MPRIAVLFEIGVSDHSKAYEPIYGKTVAQLEVRKTLILLGNSGFGRSCLAPGGREFESLRARM